ncbi:MAG: PQQ-binding-like beta-propeller repeat protein [Planctomycetota bacterium]
MSVCGRRGAVLIVMGAAMVAAIARADWPHWRGDGGNGVSLTAMPPVAFGPDRNLRWKVEIPGRGSSSPVVMRSRVFVTTAVPIEREPGVLDFRLLCFDRETGRELWSRSCVKAMPHEGSHETNGFASASPCTDGELVLAHFGSQGLHGFTVAGEPLWSRDFGDMTVRNGFGEGSSPTLAGDLVIVPWDHEGPSRLFALDKRTGKTVWETPRDEPTCWATPLVVTDAGGITQLVMNGQTAARGYDVATGRELWRCGGQAQRPCASAVAADGVAFIGSGFRGSFLGAFDLPAAATSPAGRRSAGRRATTRPTSPPPCSLATGSSTTRRRPVC